MSHFVFSNLWAQLEVESWRHSLYLLCVGKSVQASRYCGCVAFPFLFLSSQAQELKACLCSLIFLRAEGDAFDQRLLSRLP